MKERARNLTEGFLITFLGLLVIFFSLKLGKISLQTANQSMGLFPSLLGIIFVACGVRLGLRVEGRESKSIHWPTLSQAFRVLFVFLSLLSYIPAVKLFGYPFATALIFGIQAWLLGAKGMWRICFLAVVVSIVAAYAFQNLLEIDLPDGLIPRFLGVAW